MVRCSSLAAIVCTSGLLIPSIAAADEKSPRKFSREVLPILQKYCIRCHGPRRARADVRFDRFKTEADVLKDRKLWLAVSKNVVARIMPPSNPKLSDDEIKKITRWVEHDVMRVDCSKPHDPGRVTIRRLNKVEYRNTIRDLVGIDYKPAVDFPADDVGYGFDNIGDVLTLSPLHFERYFKAADVIIEKAIKDKELETAAKDSKSVREFLVEFANRAYRRPVKHDEVQRLLALVDLARKKGKSTEVGLKLACKAILTSPHFLFRVELDHESKPGTVYEINEFELASRLSYFLWSSMPDDELFRLAKSGQLRKHLDKQVRRMLADPKSQALTKNFAGQWLQLRSLSDASPDPKRFPNFDKELRQAMLRETELFFTAVVKEDRSILDFIDADFSFVNERLARHYSIDGVRGDEFRRVKLSGNRAGILTHASILTITSNPTRTSPVIRGKYILENILGTPPPPPLPNVGELDDDGKELQGSVRQRLEAHRAKPICASCHQQMDPLGFAFENFDAVGAWRTHDG